MVTIVVLLILAAVSLNLVLGENGIITKASAAKEKHLIATYKERIEMIVADEQLEEQIHGKELTVQSLIDRFLEERENYWVRKR